MDLLENRSRLKMSQGEFAKKLGIGRSLYIKYEKGERDAMELKKSLDNFLLKKDSVEEKSFDQRKELAEISVLAETVQSSSSKLYKLVEKILSKE